ncbi:MAG TPA: hypothetical protein VFT22_00280, partial [Kofleriaceae bacterium]|nr:hypothetical protein [Kofleriaceae bacterium]
MSAIIARRFLWLAGTCALWLGCGRPASGPALQILGESVRLRIDDPPPAISPWFDGTRVSVVAARGETIGLVVVHRGGGPVTLTLTRGSDAARRAIAVHGYAVEALAVTRPSTGMYGGSHGAGAYADGLSPSDAPASDPVYFELEVPRYAEPGVVEGTLAVAGRALPVAVTIVPVTLPPLPLRVWAYEDARESVWAGSDERACIAMFA